MKPAELTEADMNLAIVHMLHQRSKDARIQSIESEATLQSAAASLEVWRNHPECKDNIGINPRLDTLKNGVARARRLRQKAAENATMWEQIYNHALQTFLGGDPSLLDKLNDRR